LEFIYVVFKF